MQIAVLSGKGGTGKTFVSVNLSAAVDNAVYVDADVEEPNGFLFFRPEKTVERTINRKVPIIDESRCDLCQECMKFCRYNAIAYVGKKMEVFPELCHSCGGCQLVCPRKAITEIDHPLGSIKEGVHGEHRVLSGFLRPNEQSGIPIIKELLKLVEKTDAPVFLDCPPGSGCPVIESVAAADFCVLVAEPTVFGLHDLDMVHELAKIRNKPHAIIINKATDDNRLIEDYCKDKGIKLLGRIPFDRELASMNSDGKIIAEQSSAWKDRFKELYFRILEEVSYAANPDS